MNALTFKQLTAPGFFNFRSTALQTTKNLIAWFDAMSKDWTDQATLMDSFFRGWLTYDYSLATIPRTPYVALQLHRWGLSWFLGSDKQAAGLIELVSRSYSKSTSQNILFLFEKLSQNPFLWCLNPPQIVYGPQYPAIYAETFVIYSSAGSMPATPSPTTYTPRAWTAPAGWNIRGSASTWISRGYLSGGNIVWMTPIDATLAYPYYQSTNIAGLPPSPATGSTASVFNDGSGDQGAIYYFDGAAWQKTSSPNANQGQLGPGGSIPTPQPRAVWSPNPDTNTIPITSNLQPPVSGPSKGYGMYAGYAQQIIQSRNIFVVATLTNAGFNNLGIIINLLRRIKPTLNPMTLYYSIDGSMAPPVHVTIKDIRTPK